MALNDIASAFLAVEADIAAGAYAQGVKDAAVVLTDLADLAQGLGFKAGPADAQTATEIENTCKRCLDACAKDKKKAAVGTFDWKSLLAQILTTLLQWWISRPTPPAPAPTP